jgi:hypothetical protein
MQQLQQSVEEPVPPAVIDSHHPAPASAAAAGRGAKKTKMIVKGFLAHPEHKSLLPIDYKDVCLFILSSCVLSLAAGAGIGGPGRAQQAQTAGNNSSTAACIQLPSCCRLTHGV